MIDVPNVIHTLSVSDNVKSRIRIYSIPNSLTVFTEANIIQYGTLFKRNVSDTDSGERISESGLAYLDYFNKDAMFSIGQSTCSRVEFVLLNDDHAYDSFNFGRIYIFIDMWNPSGNEWVSVPIGAFVCEKPAKTTSRTIDIAANDLMQTLERPADNWFNNEIDWTTNKTLFDIASSLATKVGIPLGVTTGTFPQSLYEYSNRPFFSIGKTYRQILEYIAGACVTNVFINRLGQIDFGWFDDAVYTDGGVDHYITIDADSDPTPVFDIDVSAFTVPHIKYVTVIQSGAEIVTVSSGDFGGNETYYVKDNPLFVDGADASNTAEILAANVLAGINLIISDPGTAPYPSPESPGYTPISVKSVIDVSIESGDAIRVVSNGNTYRVPVFQQTWIWRGGYIVSQFMSNGAETWTDQYDAGSAFTDSESRRLNSFESGFVNRTVIASGSTYTVTIPFSKYHSKVPNVVACLVSAQTEGLGNCSVSVWNLTNISFSLRIINNSDYQRSIGVCWIAVENYESSATIS